MRTITVVASILILSAALGFALVSLRADGNGGAASREVVQASPSRQPTPIERLAPVAPSAAAPTPVSPYVTDTGISIPVSTLGVLGETDSEDLVCIADAQIEVKNGKVKRILMKGTKVRIEVGEVVISAFGDDVTKYPDYAAWPVHRRSAGVLVLGWEHCDPRPTPLPPP